MHQRLLRAGAVAGAALSALVVGGVTEAAFAAPSAPATPRMSAVERPQLVPAECGVVPGKPVVTHHGGETVVTTRYFACTTFKPPQPSNDLPPGPVQQVRR